MRDFNGMTRSDVRRGPTRKSGRNSAGSGLERASNRDGDAVPLRGFFSELPAPGARERVVLRPPVVLGRLPGRCEPPRFLEAMQCGKERAGLNHERPARDLLDAAGDAEPCCSPVVSAFRIRRSSVPWRSVVREDDISCSLSSFDTRAQHGEFPIECQPETRKRKDRQPLRFNERRWNAARPAAGSRPFQEMPYRRRQWRPRLPCPDTHVRRGRT